MPKVVDAPRRSKDLLKAAEELDPVEFDHFASDFIALLRRRSPAGKQALDVQLVAQLNVRLPAAERRRLYELNAKREAETLTKQQHQELIRLCEKSEQFDADRLRALIELAILRKTPLALLAKEFRPKAP
jgi:hypothetical protein